MKRRYRKAGSTIRIEREGSRETRLELMETGQVEETSAGIESKNGSDAHVHAKIDDETSELLRDVDAAIGNPGEVERLTLVAGRALHQLDDDQGTLEWSDQFIRLHISIARREERLRVDLDFGGADRASLDISAIRETAAALRQCGATRRVSDMVELSPAITSGLWLRMLGADRRVNRESALILRQGTHPEFLRDGYGRLITPVAIASFGMEDREVTVPPNFYRPSFRSRPVRFPFHLVAELEHEHEPRGEAPLVALSIVGPSRNGITRFLMRDRHSEESFVTDLAFSLRDWIERIESISTNRTWFPFGAGSYGVTALVRLG